LEVAEGVGIGPDCLRIQNDNHNAFFDNLSLCLRLLASFEFVVGNTFDAICDRLRIDGFEMGWRVDV
jgi:hypothetical protein